MARGVQIAFTLNPREFVKGLKTIDTDLDKVKDALEETADAANDAFDDLDTGDVEKGLQDVEKAAGDAESAFGDLSSEAKSELGKVETAAKQAGAEVESEIEGGARDAESAFAKLARGAKADMAKVERAAGSVDDELGDIESEANASAKEFGSAFRGDPVEALEEVQSYLAEIISVKLPGFAGAAAAVAGGAALGLIVAGVEKWREKQERINEIATDFVGIIQEGVDGPLSQTNRAYDDLIDKQLTLAVLEEASAAQLSNLATLAAARGETTEEYVRKTLTGEITTQEQLAGIQQRRNDIADELLRITTDNNDENDDQIPILQAQDAALQDQATSLRSVGGFINENVAGYGKAKAAQDNVTKATEASREKQRALNKAAADQAPIIDTNKRKADGLNASLDRDIDKGLTLRVDDSAYDRGLAEWVKPAYKTVYVTEQRRDAARASAGGIQPGRPAG